MKMHSDRNPYPREGIMITFTAGNSRFNYRIAGVTLPDALEHVIHHEE